MLEALRYEQEVANASDDVDSHADESEHECVEDSNISGRASGPSASSVVMPKRPDMPELPPPRDGMPLGKQARLEAQDLVFLYVGLLIDGGWAQASRRAIIDEALRLIDDDGRRFWGAYGIYSRRRTVLDRMLQLWAHVRPAS